MGVPDDPQRHECDSSTVAERLDVRGVLLPGARDEVIEGGQGDVLENEGGQQLQMDGHHCILVGAE